jgi:hypothetical protein
MNLISTYQADSVSYACKGSKRYVLLRRISEWSDLTSSPLSFKERGDRLTVKVRW